MGSFRIFLDTDVLINWLAQEINSAILVSRDDEFMELAKKLNVEADTPEEFLESYFSNIFERIKDDLVITKEK